MNLFKKSFVVFSIPFVFLLGLALIPTDKADAAIVVNVTADSMSIPYKGNTIIRWNSTGATSCTPPSGYSSAGTGTTGFFNTGALTATTTFTVTCSKAAYCSGTYGEEADWNGNTWDGGIVLSVLKGGYWGWMEGYVYGDVHCGYCSDNGKTGYRVSGSSWYSPTCNKYGWPWCKGSSWSSDNGPYVGSAYVTRDCSAFSGSQGLCQGLCYWNGNRCAGGGSCSSRLTASSCYAYPYYSRSCTWNP